jgi:hypothetical protein
VTATSSPSPTATDDALVCDTSDLVGGSVDGQEVTLGLRNEGDSFIRITRISLDWPILNSGLVRIKLGAVTIWSQGDLLPPTVVTSGWDDPVRAVQAGETKPLTFVFNLPAQESGYDLAVQLNNECQLTRSA